VYQSKPAHFTSTKISGKGGKGSRKVGPSRKIDMDRYPYEIIENEFHGGGHISYATRYDLALRNVQKYIDEDIENFGCYCGGPIIVRTDRKPITQEEMMVEGKK